MKLQCPECASFDNIKYGKDKNGKQRYKCKDCNYRFFEIDYQIKAMPLFKQFLLIALLYGSLAFLFGGVLLATTVQIDTFQMLLFLKILLPSLTVAVLFIDVVSLILMYHPIWKGLKVIEDKGDNRLLIQKALVMIFNMPFLTLVRIMGIHGPAVMCFIILGINLMNRYFNMGVQDSQIFIPVVLAMTTTVPSHALLEYFAVLKLVRPVIAFTKQYAGNLPSKLQSRIIRINIRQRLFFITVTVTFIPLFVMGASVLLRVDDILRGVGIENTFSFLISLIIWIGGLILVVSIFMISIAALMSKDMHDLTNDLLMAMEYVKTGNMNARLNVTTTDEFSTLYNRFNEMTHGLRERSRLQDAFGRYISPELAKTMMKGSTIKSNIVRATVLFADIRGFTSLSENLPPDDTIDLLNGYFALVEPAINKKEGWINKFLGDGFMVLFGIPITSDNHEKQAIDSALAIIEALKDFNEEQKKQKKITLQVGIGIHSGEMVAGNIGSPNRLEYTVIGDTVNTASRIESLNKEMGTTILISDNVYQVVKDDVEVKVLSPVRVKGKSQRIKVYSLIGHK